MANHVTVKTILLYDKRKVDQETLARIAEAKDGDMIGVESTYFNAFKPLVIMQTEARRAVKNHGKKS